MIVTEGLLYYIGMIVQGTAVLYRNDCTEGLLYYIGMIVLRDCCIISEWLY